MHDVEGLLREALKKTSAAEVWAHLSPLRPRLGEREVALSWMTLAQASPRDKQLGADAAAVLAAHAGDEEVVIATLTALVRRVDAGGLDAPIDVEVPLRRGIEAAEALPSKSAALVAALGNALARIEGPSERALARLTEAVERDAAGPWLADVVLVLKRARRFRAALVPARNLVKRHAGEPGPLVELAIVALGAGEPVEAADALRRLGAPVEMSDDALPFVPDLPELAVRLPVQPPPAAPLGGEGARFETIWVQPLSPVHGVVRSAVFGQAVTDFGDVILFDAARLGAVERPDGTGRAPLLPFLSVLRAGDERRLRFLALEQKEGQVAAVLSALPEGCLVMPHGTRVERVCPRCLAGETLVKHEHLPPEDQRFVFGKLIVPANTTLESVASALEAKKKDAPGVLLAIPSLYETLGRTAEAGKHHKTWGAIERGLGARA